MNFKIQSTSSDIVLWVLSQIAPVITKDLQGFLHATVHDSIVFSVPTPYLTQIPDLMYEYGTKRILEKFPWMPVPFLWDTAAGPSYGEVINIHKYIEGINDDQNQKEEFISGYEIREEINSELSL